MKKVQIWHEFVVFLQRFVVIYGFTMLATLVFLLLFNRSAMVGWPFFLRCVVFSLAGDLPSFVFYSAHELSESEWRKRMLVCILLCEVILMPLGHGWMWLGWGGGVLFFVTILAVTLGVRCICLGIDTHTANVLNEQIRKRRLENKQK